MDRLLPHEQRVVIERDELLDKFQKLTQFMTTETFEKLWTYNRNLLKDQHGVMMEYLHILNERIREFKVKE